MAGTTRVVFWNAESVRGKVNLLKAFLTEQKVDIVILNETHLKPSDKFKVPNYYTYRKDDLTERGEAYRGTAVLVRRNIIHQPLQLPELDSLCACGVQVKVGDQELNVYAVYKPPRAELDHEELRSLFKADEATILAGDFNLKHTA